MLDVDKRGITTYVVTKNVRRLISSSGLELLTFRCFYKHCLSWDFCMFQQMCHIWRQRHNVILMTMLNSALLANSFSAQYTVCRMFSHNTSIISVLSQLLYNNMWYILLVRLLFLYKFVNAKVNS